LYAKKDSVMSYIDITPDMITISGATTFLPGYDPSKKTDSTKVVTIIDGKVTANYVNALTIIADSIKSNAYLSSPLIAAGNLRVGSDVNGTNDGVYINTNNYWYDNGSFRVGKSTSGIAYNAGSNNISLGTDCKFFGDITRGSGESILKIDTNGIYLGSSLFSSAEFSVTPAGVLKATNADITGTINAGSTITGATIVSNLFKTSTENNRLELTSNNTLDFYWNGTKEAAMKGAYATSGIGAHIRIDGRILFENVPWIGNHALKSTDLSDFPTTAGANTYLKNDGSGNLTWASVSGSGGGTVTSVQLAAGTGPGSGLVISGDNPITTSGTITIAVASGYVMPSTTNFSNWQTAYGWGNHASAGYLTSSVIGSTVQGYDSDLSDLSDGSLSGSKVGTGINWNNITVNKPTFGTISAKNVGGTMTINFLDDMGDQHSIIIVDGIVQPGSY
jgi:hypothetical protein